MTKDQRPKTKELPGFTLLEMIVSTGIFSIIVIASIGIMLSVTKAQLRTANLQAIQDNIRFSTELLTKEMRTGQKYQLTTACTPTVGEEISFDATSGPRVYYLDDAKKALMRIKGAPTPTCDNAAQLTGEDITVETFLVQLRGQIVGANDGQPMATLALKISATDPVSGNKTIMNLQTTVVQRIRDL